MIAKSYRSLQRDSGNSHGRGGKLRRLWPGNIGVSDGGTILYLTDLLDRLGIDARVGQAIALAYEAYNKGLLTKKETEGLDLKWGNAEAAIELLKKIINKEGIGAILEKGPKEAARILSEMTGNDLKPFSTDMKGLSCYIA